MELFAKGKRGEIYLDYIGKKRILIKKSNPLSTAINRIQNEIKWLKKLNKHKIGPKLLKSNKDSFTMEFIEGQHFDKWFKKNKDKKILKDILKQCRVLDKLKVNKYELHSPTKNIIINKKPILIDFERCKYDLNPKNVTQFSQFLYKKKIIKDLKPIKDYKKNQTDSTFLKILSSF